MDPNFTCNTCFTSIQPECKIDTASFSEMKTNANPCAVDCSAGLAWFGFFSSQIDARAFAGVFSVVAV